MTYYVKTQKSHPREWVDCSDPTYTRAQTEFLNPTHGSGWIVQIRPTREHKPSLESHPREWVDGSDPTYTRAQTQCLNPTHGSGWIVQIRPSKQSGRVQLRASSVSCALYVSE